MDTGEAERRFVVELVVGEPASGQEPLEFALPHRVLGAP